MDHAQAESTFSDYLDGTLAARLRTDVDQHLGVCIQCRTELESLRRTVGSLGRLKQAAPPSLLPDIKQQIYRRSRGRFFRPRWKLFGRIPFEWVSLATIIAMLVYYIAMLHSTPGGVRPAP
jgi:anti-sigma factor RsiW